MQLTDSTSAKITLNNGTSIPQLGFGTLAVQPDRQARPPQRGLVSGISLVVARSDSPCTAVSPLCVMVLSGLSVS
jgi:hypothetical protein